MRYCLLAQESEANIYSNYIMYYLYIYIYILCIRPFGSSGVFYMPQVLHLRLMHPGWNSIGPNPVTWGGVSLSKRGGTNKNGPCCSNTKLPLLTLGKRSIPFSHCIFWTLIPFGGRSVYILSSCLYG